MVRKLAAGLALLALLVAAFWMLRGASWEAAEVDPSASQPRVQPDSGVAPIEPADTKPIETQSEPVRMAAESPPAPTAAIAPAMVIVVLDSELQPLPDVRLMVLDSQDQFRTARTDETGRASFEPRTDRGIVFLMPREAQPLREDIDLSGGERRIVLPAGVELSGWVTVGGTAPAQKISLYLESDQALFDVPENVPKVREFLMLHSGRHAFTAVGATDSRGRFSFRGLDPRWSGEITVPREYLVRHAGIAGSSKRSLRIERPQPGLLIDLEQLPLLRGRVVAESGVESIKKLLSVSCAFYNGAATLYALTTRTDANGRFAFAAEPDFTEVRLVVESPLGDLVQRMTSAKIGDDLDVGDLVLVTKSPTGLELVIRVQDSEGKPIVAALGRTTLEPNGRFSDERGEIRWKDQPEGEMEVRLAADGFWPVKKSIIVPAAEMTVITLLPCNELAITIEDEQGAGVSGIELGLSCGVQNLFPNQEGDFQDRKHFSGVGLRENDESGERWQSFRPLHAGQFVVQRIPASLELNLRVIDSLRVELLAQTIPALAPDERRELSLHLERALRTIVVTVCDEQARPLPATQVLIEDPGGPFRKAGGRANASGQFRMEGLSASRVHLSAEHEGYGNTARNDVVLDQPLTEVTLVLRNGRKVAVEVVDVQGHAVDMDAEWPNGLSAARPGGNAEWSATRIGANRFEFRDLPRDGLDATLRLSGNSYPLPLAPDQTSARIEIPVHGRIEASLAAPSSAPRSPYVLRVARRGSTEPVLTRHVDQAVETTLVFPSVSPGEYEVFFVSESAKLPQPLTPAQSVTVIAGATAKLSLHYPE